MIAPPTPKEFQDQVAFVELLRSGAMSPEWRFTHIPSGEYRDIRTAMKLKRMGLNPGWPDFVFVGPEATVLWLELKRRKGGALMLEQMNMRDHLVACDCTYVVFDNIALAVEKLREFGILRAAVMA